MAAKIDMVQGKGALCTAPTPNVNKYGNSVLHPVVRYIQEGFGHESLRVNGELPKWWMVQTPHFKNDYTTEDVHLYYAYGEEPPTTWNPISNNPITPTHEKGFNSDPTMIIDNGRMYIINREVSTPSNDADNSLACVYVVSSSDGINWNYVTDKKKLFGIFKSDIINPNASGTRYINTEIPFINDTTICPSILKETSFRDQYFTNITCEAKNIGKNQYVIKIGNNWHIVDNTTNATFDIDTGIKAIGSAPSVKVSKNSTYILTDITLEVYRCYCLIYFDNTKCYGMSIYEGTSLDNPYDWKMVEKTPILKTNGWRIWHGEVSVYKGVHYALYSAYAKGQIVEKMLYSFDGKTFNVIDMPFHQANSTYGYEGGVYKSGLIFKDDVLINYFNILQWNASEGYPHQMFLKTANMPDLIVNNDIPF